MSCGVEDMLRASAAAADRSGVAYGSPAVQAGRALVAAGSTTAALAHAEQIVQHLRVLQREEAGTLPTASEAE